VRLQIECGVTRKQRNMNFLHNSVEVVGGWEGLQSASGFFFSGLSTSTSSRQVRYFIPFDRFYIFFKLRFKNSQLISK
jgi:hypothetical protein